MTFTSNPPTVPGAYWWKSVEFYDPTLVHVDEAHSQLLAYTVRHNGATLESLGGVWSSRLVPVEEVEKAWREGGEAIANSTGRTTKGMGDWWFNKSRAKRIVDGLE